MEIALSIGMRRAAVLFAGPNFVILDGHAIMHPCMFFDPNEVIILFLLLHSLHVLVEIIVNILVAIASIESLQE